MTHRPAAQPSRMSLGLAYALIERRVSAARRQSDIAKEAGVTEATIQRLEKGRWPMDPATLERIVTVYGHLSVEPRHPVVVWAEAVRATNDWRGLSDAEVSATLRKLLSQDGRQRRVSAHGQPPNGLGTGLSE